MKIKFKNESLYYKFKDIKFLSDKNNVSLKEAKVVEDDIVIEFNNESDYKKLLNELCIIPIDHKVLNL